MKVVDRGRPTPTFLDSRRVRLSWDLGSVELVSLELERVFDAEGVSVLVGEREGKSRSSRPSHRRRPRRCHMLCLGRGGSTFSGSSKKPRDDLGELQELSAMEMAIQHDPGDQEGRMGEDDLKTRGGWEGAGHKKLSRRDPR